MIDSDEIYEKLTTKTVSLDRKYNVYTHHQIDKAISQLEKGAVIKDIAIENQINYKYLCKLWVRKRKGYPIRIKR